MASVLSGTKPKNRTCLCSLCFSTARRSVWNFEISSPMITSLRPSMRRRRVNANASMSRDDVLVRLHVPDIQHERIAKLIPLADAVMASSLGGSEAARPPRCR